MDRYSHYDSPLGGITLASDGAALTGLWFDGASPFISDSSVGAGDSHPVFDTVRRWLDIYFRGAEPGFTPPLLLKGSAFRMEVWKILQTIPFGKTMTYGEIAGILGARRGTGHMSAQAVGGAVGHNPIALIVPCHRVVGAGGALTGYAYGLERKSRLLGLERGVLH